LRKLISFTTRNKRPGEIDGVDYHFIDEKDIKDLNILQQMKIYGNHYGTSKEHLEEGYDHILVVGVDGPQQFIDIFGELAVLTYFVYSPWYKRLYRLIKRDGWTKGANRFFKDIGRFRHFDKSSVEILKN
jgi:guanylate kinase